MDALRKPDPSLSNQCTWSSLNYQRSPAGSCSTAAAASSGEVPFFGCQRDREVTRSEKVSDTSVQNQ